MLGPCLHPHQLFSAFTEVLLSPFAPVPLLWNELLCAVTVAVPPLACVTNIPVPKCWNELPVSVAVRSPAPQPGRSVVRYAPYVPVGSVVFAPKPFTSLFENVGPCPDTPLPNAARPT